MMILATFFSCRCFPKLLFLVVHNLSSLTRSPLRSAGAGGYTYTCFFPAGFIAHDSGVVSRIPEISGHKFGRKFSIRQKRNPERVSR